jgi:hypothetical protein
MNEQSKKMNDLLRGAVGRTSVSSETLIGGPSTEVRSNEGAAADSIGGQADGGEGGSRGGEAFDMNAELRRATGRPGHTDDRGRSWA